MATRFRAGLLVRFVSSVLITTGVLLLVDAVLTVTWQEPISSFMASRSQHGLEDELQRAGGDFARAHARPARRADRFEDTAGLLARRWARGLDEGHAVGRIDLPAEGRDFVVSEGTDTATLRRGPGHYPDTALPGQGRTVAVAGHRTTYLAPFRRLDRLRRGDPVVLEMPYGRFTYRVEGTRIVTPAAVWVKRDVGYERLVLTACHPLYSAAERIVAFARLVKAEPAPTGASSRDSSSRTSATTRASDTATTSSQ